MEGESKNSKCIWSRNVESTKKNSFLSMNSTHTAAPFKLR